MNTGALFSGILLILAGIFFEVLTRISKSKSRWLRARVYVVIGIVVIVLSILFT